MNFFIRTNIGTNIGIGHLVRVSRLADRLHKLGHKCWFFVDHLPKNNFEIFRKNKLHPIYSNKKKFSTESKAAKIYNLKTSEIGRGFVIVDDYRLSHVWEKIVNKKHLKLLAFDDLEDKKHYADFILNYNPRHYENNLYNKKNIIKKNCKLLVDPRYNIINPTSKRGSNYLESKSFEILFYAGGGGDHRYFYKTISKLLNITKKVKKKITVKVIIGPLSKNKNLIFKLSKKNKQITPIVNETNLSKHIAKAKIFIGAAGTAIFETSFYKIPTILFQMSKNQKNDYSALEKLGHYLILNKEDLRESEKIAKLIITLVEQYKRFKNLVKNRSIHLDNKGVNRIAKVILGKNKAKIDNKKNLKKSNFKNKILLKKALDEEINHYLQSRNLPLNRQQSTHNKKISSIDHYIWWFKNRRNSFVLTKNQKKILYIYDEKIYGMKDTDYFLSGWFACSKECTGKEIMFALNWQRKLYKKSIKKIIWLGFVNSNNVFGNYITKYFFGKRISNKNNFMSKILKRNFNVNTDYSFYYRKG